MGGDWHLLIGLVVGVLVLFAATLGFGLRFSAHQQSTNRRQITTATVWPFVAAGPWRQEDLLYGVWQTQLSDVVLQVRNGIDAEVATITHRLSGATIDVDGEVCRAVCTSGWRQRAVLRRDGDDVANASNALCTFECSGWFGGRVARYVVHDGAVLTLRSRWNLLWTSAALAIERDGRPIGQLLSLGGALRNSGRALVLPATIPLPVRLFLLSQAMGVQAARGNG